ncbi:MAG: glycoside hydrolase family 125 protein [Ferruginibacter sp.]
MKRSTFIQQSAFATAALFTEKLSFATGSEKEFPVVRIAENLRKFKSPAVEKLIAEIKKNVSNKEIAWLFENCFPNTLDTTVEFEIINGRPDTFVITGDIDAMWLRDSSAQVWPYLPLMKADKNLQELIKGVINRQVKCVLKDPYANAFYKDETKISEWKNDKTEMKPGVHERKWEIDSLCYVIRLSHGYWKETGDITVFDKDWKQAMSLVIKTFKEQQRLENEGPYKFERTTSWATDGVALGGYGYPGKKIGLIFSMFRPSDDATLFPFTVSGNMFAMISLEQLNDLLAVVDEKMELRRTVYELKKQLSVALEKNVIVKHEKFGNVIAYEINGFGSYNLMDDANVPSLLSLPYLTGDFMLQKEEYHNTRKMLLSEYNPFYFKGKAGEGIGGPHVGMNYVWPMSIIMRALTSKEDQEIKFCLTMLQQTHAGTGFMHESFHKDDATKYTRKWFAWANTLLGELIWKVYRERLHLLRT